MSLLHSSEQQGLRDFFRFHVQESIAFDLAKLTCNNLLHPSTFEESVDLIILHSPSATGILNRKLVTKGLLFKYLNDRKIPANLQLSKNTLIEKIIRYWLDTFSEQPQGQQPAFNSEPSFRTITAETPASSEHFPIHKMARQFTGWFFEQFNQNRLTIEDFWPDARGQLDMREQPNCVREESADDAHSLLDTLMGLKQRFNMFFNPSVTHAGNQGRIDPHGLVLVLGCGTIHSPQGVVGCFECVFGLIRDPFTDNNWKVKNLQMRLNGSSVASVTNGGVPNSEMMELRECETLQHMLALPSGDMDLQ